MDLETKGTITCGWHLFTNGLLTPTKQIKTARQSSKTSPVSAIQCKDGLRKARTDIPSKAVVAKFMKFNLNVVEIISVRGIILAVYWCPRCIFWGPKKGHKAIRDVVTFYECFNKAHVSQTRTANSRDRRRNKLYIYIIIYNKNTKVK